MSENDSPGFREINNTVRVFKREKSVEINDGTLSGEEDFLGFGDLDSEGLLLTQSSLFSSNAPTLSELDTEVASSVSDIGSAIFDHDYISTQNFQENIQMAMRRSDSSDDQGIQQLLYDDNGTKFNVQDIEGRFKLLLNISSSILNSRSAELADQTSVTDFLNRLCEQTQSMKQKFSMAVEEDPKSPDNDSGRASKTPPSSDEPIDDVEIEPAEKLPDIEEEEPLVSTCLDEQSMQDYAEVVSKVDELSKMGTDVISSMDELKKTLPLSVTSEILVESRGILKKKIHEMQLLLKSFDPQVETGMQTEVCEVLEVGVQTEEIPVEDPVAPIEDVPEVSVEPPEEETPQEENQPADELLDVDLDPAGLLAIPKFESTEVQNERMKRKLLDRIDSSSDEAPSEDDSDDPTFSVKMFKRKRKNRKRMHEEDLESDKEDTEALEVPEIEEPQITEDSDSLSQFDLLNYTISAESDSEDLTEKLPEVEKPLKEIPEDVEVPVDEVPEKIQDEEQPEPRISLDEELLEKIPDEVFEKAVAEAEMPEDAPLEDIPMDFEDLNDTEADATELTSIVEETKNVMLLNNEEIPLTTEEPPKENGIIEAPEKEIEEPKTLDLNSDSSDSDDDKELPTALEPVVNLETLDKQSLEDYFDDINEKEIDKLLDFTTLERRRYESTKTAESKESEKPRKPEKKKDQLLDILQEVKAGEMSDSSSESSEDELTEEQFLEQCNMNVKHRLLNFSSDESEEELDASTINKLYRKKSGDEDEDADSINSDASAIVDDFLMNIVQKEIADDVGGEKLSDEEANKENTPKDNEMPNDKASEEVEKPPEILPTVDIPDDVQIVEDQPLEKEKEATKEDETDQEASSSTKSKAMRVSGVEKIILSDKIFEGIEVRKDLKERLPRSLKILSSDDESEKDSRSQGEEGANECLDTSMFNKKDDTKTSEEINRILAKYDSRATTTQVKENTRVLSETISLSSDSDVDEVVEDEVEKEAPRRNIRAMLSDDQLEVETKRAQREEKERITRLEEKTNSLSQRMSQTENLSVEESDIVLDFHSKTKKYISVHPAVVKYLKPHQIDGIRFMYDNVYGGIDYINQHVGSGCILAHCMGLGKTLQLIALLHTVIRYPELKTNRILVICPKTTIMNWFEEIRKWLKPVRGDISMKVFYFPDNSDVHAKLKILKEWQKSGERGFRNAGCLLIGYEAFRVLVLKQSRKQQSIYTQQETALIKKQVTETLLDPGADLVICDEGHMIKNRKSAINRAVTKIRTRRRIILTGTPIQNNLKEYYCMVDFIKPSFLGTEREFANMYTNPIKSGQHKDSTKQEIKCMKQRSYVLHKKLSRFVQRREAAVLKQFLPEKFEYVLFIPMTPVQERLYEFFLTHNPTKEISGKSLIPDYTALRKIWTHPKVLENAWENAMIAKEKRERARARLHPESDDEVPDDVLDKQVGAMSVLSDWWRPHLTKEDLESIVPSNKLKVIFEILKLCQANGEKCLIFSAFVAVLNVVEYFMRKINNKDENAAKYGLREYDGPWEHGKDFYRLDGKTPKTLRHSMVQSFNNPLNSRMRCFLISAKAGGQGINLTGANRVIILDTSWNPSNDQQNIFRIYRLGQERKCFVYRLLAMGTMEEKVYSRSVTKQAMSFRVVDEQQIDRHYNMAELAELYKLTKTDMSLRPTPNLPTDFLLRNLLLNHFSLIYKYHEHDSLLENKPEQDLSEADKKEAWDAYENDLKTQKSGAFDQSALNAGLMGLNNYFNTNNPNLSSINYGAGLSGRNYPTNYGNSLNSSMSLLNQLSYQSGMGLNQDPMMLMNQLYQSYPMGMGSSSIQSPYMGYMNQNSYYGSGMYPSTSLSSSSNLGQQYKNLQSLAEIAMLPDTNLIPRSQSVSPSTANSPGLVVSSAATMQRNTPSRSMWNLMSTPNYYTPGMATSTVQSSTSTVAKTTPSTSTVISSTVHPGTLPGVTPQLRVKTSLAQKSPHTSIPTSVITSIPATGSPLALTSYSRAEERPSSSSSPQPHVILKAATTQAQKEKEPPALTKVTNMGIVYPTIERESLVPSLSSLSPATITKIPTTKASIGQATPQKDPKTNTLSSLLGFNPVLQNVTVTPSTKITKAPSTTLTPIVTTTVKPGVKVLPGSVAKTPVPVKKPERYTNPVEMVQNLHNVTVKPSVGPVGAQGKRQPYVYTAKGKKPIQINQRVVVGNHTSITPITRPPVTKAIVSPATLARATVSQVTPTKPQGPHLTRISRLVPSTITTPATVHQTLQRMNVGGTERMIVTKKTTPQITVVKPAAKPMTPLKRTSVPGVSGLNTPPALTKVGLTPAKRPSTTPISELIANSKTISITQVKKPNSTVISKPSIAPHSSATLQKITLPVRSRTVNKVPPTVLSKDPEIVELD